MPRVTQYIRNEDLDKWNALPNKAEFIHNALVDSVLDDMKGSGEALVEAVEKTTRAAVKPIIKTKQDAIEAIKPLLGEDWRGPLFRDKKNKKL